MGSVRRPKDIMWMRNKLKALAPEEKGQVDLDLMRQ